MGDGDPGGGRHSGERRHARHDLEGDAGRGQRLDLLAAAAEDERVAALQPHHLEACSPELDEQLVQLGLSELLARDHERLRGRLLDELGRDEDVVDERVAATDQLEPADGDETRVARARRRRGTPSREPLRDEVVEVVAPLLVGAKRAFTSGRSDRSSSASSACSGPTSSAICERSRFASAGEAPPVETATAIGPSRCTAGRMKLQSSGHVGDVAEHARAPRRRA